jgi:alpha-beta hydrolase superfamily lysophospholipase
VPLRQDKRGSARNYTGRKGLAAARAARWSVPRHEMAAKRDRAVDAKRDRQEENTRRIGGRTQVNENG